MPLFRELWAEEVVTTLASSTGSSSNPSAPRCGPGSPKPAARSSGSANSRLRWALQAEGDRGHLVGCAARLPPSRPRDAPLRDGRGAHRRPRRPSARIDRPDDEPDARAFARRLGFEEGRSEQYWELDGRLGGRRGSRARRRGLRASGCARCATANASSSSCTTPPSGTCRTTTPMRWRSRTGYPRRSAIRARPRPERSRPRRRPAGGLRLAHRRPGGGVARRTR